MHPNYVWMIHNWYNLDWWKNSSCTIEEMKKVVISQIVIDHYPRIDEKDKNKTNIGGVVSNYAIKPRWLIKFMVIK